MYSLNDIKSATKIYVTLLDKGTLAPSSDSELLNCYNANQNVQAVVESMAQESDVFIERFGDSVYLIPGLENEFIGYKRAELKIAILGRKVITKMEDYYLSIYIIIVLLSLFYSGRGTNPQIRDSLEISGLELSVNERLEQLSKKDLTPLEGETGLAISTIANLWINSSNEDEYAKAGTRKWYVRQVCEFLRKEELVNILEERTIIPTTKLNRLVTNHLLDMERLDEIVQIFNRDVDEEADVIDAKIE